MRMRWHWSSPGEGAFRLAPGVGTAHTGAGVAAEPQWGSAQSSSALRDERSEETKGNPPRR